MPVNTINHSTMLNQADFNMFEYPVNITHPEGELIEITLAEDIEVIGKNCVFNINTPCNFNGNNNTISITGISTYGGLFNSVTNNFTITKLGITTDDSVSLTANNGWFAQYQCMGSSIEYCFTNGKVNGAECGGIVGKDVNFVDFIKSCITTGVISGVGAGGIAGSTNSVEISECYSSGNITGVGAGGIVGSNCDNSIITCYSIGEISGVNTGGIAGSEFLLNNNNINSCYSTGDIKGGTGCGGIIGSGADVNVRINNCYAVGIVTNSSNQISGTADVTPVNTLYTAGWADTSANTTILSSYTNVFKKTSPVAITNIPYKLISILAGSKLYQDINTKQLIYTTTFYPILTYTNLPTPTLKCYDNTSVSSTAISNSLTKKIVMNTTYTTLLPVGTSFTIELDTNDTLKDFLNDITLTTYFVDTDLTITSSNIDSLDFPVYLYGATPITITIGENLVTNKNISFYTPPNSYVTIDGNNKSITLNNVVDYTGLVSSSSDFMLIKDLVLVAGSGTTLLDTSGWFGGNYFFGTVRNCSTSAPITGNGCGGIVGSYAAFNSMVGFFYGTCTIESCYTTGQIGHVDNYIGSGGILGNSSGQYNGECIVTNCYSTGNIVGIGAGGIAADNCSSNNGIVEISNCYSSGLIEGVESGGICGKNSGSGAKLTINSCYSTGNISTTAEGAGGILGSYASATNSFMSKKSDVTVSNCYSRGNILANEAGGILGKYAGYSDSIEGVVLTCILNVNNCYATGNTTGTNTGKIVGRYAAVKNTDNIGNPSCVLANCYGVGTGSLNGGDTGPGYSAPAGTNGIDTTWSDSTTNNHLQLTVDGTTVYKKVYPSNTSGPWYLNNFVKDATVTYNLNTQTLDYTNIWPFNNYNGLTSPRASIILGTSSSSIGSVVLSSTTKSVTFTSVPITENTNVSFILKDGNTVIEYVNLVQVQTTTTTTTVKPTTTSTTTVKPTTTTTTTLKPIDVLITQQYVNDTTFPVVFYGGTSGQPVLIKLMENVTTNKSIQFIFSTSSSVTFDGQEKTITIKDNNNYDGLIKSLSSKTIVKNLGLLSNNSTLANNSGWIGCQSFVGLVDNCYSNGGINGVGSGGIVGASSGINNTCIISYCYSTGSINNSSGGIAGKNSKCKITYCYSTGNITNSSGGISGGNTITNNGSIIISKCYSTGSISSNSGGIVGAGSGLDSICIVSDCYSIGNINNFSGGIAGNNTNCIITYSYSSGAITNSSGGISGGNTASNGGSSTVSNCYSTGSIGSNSGGITGSNSGINGELILIRCYTTGTINGGNNFIGTNSLISKSENIVHTNGWDDNSVPFSIGTIWKVLKANTPWKLYVFLSNVNYGFTAKLTYTSKDFPISPIAGGLVLVDINGTEKSDVITISNNTKTVEITGLRSLNSTLYFLTIKGTNFYINNIIYRNTLSIDQRYVDSTTFPVTVSSGIPLSPFFIKLAENITTTKNINFILPSESNVTFDGQGYKITLKSVGSYKGLITSSSNSTIVKNVGVLSNDCELEYGAGWIGSITFKGTIDNCYSTGGIDTAENGGIVGFESNCTITNCYSTGDINFGGGICGQRSYCIITNCYSTGNIYSGGGISAPRTSGTIKNCYSTGNISSGGNGGISGERSNSTITNCYSTGNIGENSGGISGTSSSDTITNCYSTGSIGNYGGGISGQASSCTITNCYSTGEIGGGGGGSGGISGGQSSGTIINCYSTGIIGKAAGGICGAESGIELVKKMNISNCYSTGIIDDGGNAIAGRNSRLNINVNNVHTDGWNDDKVPFKVETIWKIVKANTPWKLYVFLKNTVFIFNSTYTTLTYNSIEFPISPIPGDIVIVDSNGNKKSNVVTISKNSKSVQLTGLNVSTPGIYYLKNENVDWYINNYSIIFVSQSYVDSTTFPVTVVTGGRIVVTENITTTKNINFILPSESNVTFDGQGYTITLKSVSSYKGLITSSSNSTIVKNVGVLSNGSRLEYGAGWIGSITFKGTIDNCYSTGIIDYSENGGIVGGSSTCTITNCYSTGDINFGGGICGTRSSCIITNCYSTGDISSGGGISAEGSNDIITNCYSTGYISGGGGIVEQLNIYGKITNCYSTGNISSGSGGICGTLSIGTITNCYSTGNISFVCGGISGPFTSCTITNCYSTGSIDSDAGGISGQSSSGNITNCYSTGSISYRAGGICGSGSGNYEGKINISNCYTTGINDYGGNAIAGRDSRLNINVNNVHTDGWNDATANSVLNSNFFKVSPSSVTYIPYKLLAFLYTANAIMNGTTLTYTNIWPLDTTTDAYLVNDGGVRISGTPTFNTNKKLTLSNVSLTNQIQFYSLVVNGQYIDRFELIGSLVVRFSVNANYNVVINNTTDYENFKKSVQNSVANSLNINPDLITVLNLSPGSIIVELYLPTQYIKPLQTIVENGDLEIDHNGRLYPVIKNSFVVIDNICFHKDTLILTPNGYRKVQELKQGDLVKTAQGRTVHIKRMTSFIGTREKCPLYVMYKDSLAPNVPLKDLYMSNGHAFYHNGKWRHMKCSELTTQLDIENIEYYNIVLDNYLENTLVANGVEVESLFEMNGLKMHWRCEDDCCKPIIERKREL